MVRLKAKAVTGKAIPAKEVKGQITLFPIRLSYMPMAIHGHSTRSAKGHHATVESVGRVQFHTKVMDRESRTRPYTAQ